MYQKVHVGLVSRGKDLDIWWGRFYPSLSNISKGKPLLLVE